ncbi:MAG: DUF1697 domain-containing protein [Paracoccaceae bacterium]
MGWVALLRGINVGGAGKLPMAGFRGLLSGMGLRDVRTYIQSGNAVFGCVDPVGLEARITKAIETAFDFAPAVFLRSGDQMAAVLDNPFADQPGDKVHAFFLAEAAPVLDLQVLDRWIAPSERWHLAEGVFYLHHPEGIGRSKLAERLGKVIPCDMTARNLRTVGALVEMARTVS